MKIQGTIGKSYSSIEHLWIFILQFSLELFHLSDTEYLMGCNLWCSAVTYIDSTGIHAIKEIHQEYKARNIQVSLSPDATIVLKAGAADSAPPAVWLGGICWCCHLPFF
jgi:hypothetical protein